jgi:AraC-like DNA-binding protein
MTSYWNYARTGDGGDRDDLEIAAHSTSSVLSQVGHLHNEVQVVIVLEGWRSLATVAGTIRAEAGQIALMPARMFHAPMMGERSLVRNLYIAADHPAAAGVAQPVVIDGRGAENLADILDRVASCSPCTRTTESDEAMAGWIEQIAVAGHALETVAATADLSVDSFIRSFARGVGVTPAQYRIAYRLNLARAMLRNGTQPAQAAHECGFADQSHLGRYFLRTYGTTPSAYRRGMRTCRASISF